MQDVHDRWDKFFKVLEIEKGVSARDSQRAFERAMINFEGSNELHLAKKPWKQKTKVQKKKKILTKLVVSKDEKGFDVAKCQLVDDTLGDKFFNCFPFINDPILGVIVNIHHFKRVAFNIVYQSFSNIQKDKIKKRIT